MTYEAHRGWTFTGFACRVCHGPVLAHPSDGGGEDRDYLFTCERGCTRVEVYDQDDPVDFFELA